MENHQHANAPWLVAAWPGMGNVAISAGYYLMAKLGMHLVAEFPAREFFDLERVDVKDGLIHTGRLPRSRLFMWSDPQKKHDLIVFIGEAQPPSKGSAFCSQLIRHAKQIGVQRVFTFAAMATQMRPEHDSRVFAAAIDKHTLHDFKHLGMHILEEGQISGLNGVLLGIAAEAGMDGGCLLGEIPHVFSQFPFPKASLAVLNIFASMAGISLDLKELEEQGRQVEAGLEELLHRLEKSVVSQAETAETEEAEQEETGPRTSSRDKQRIEELFSAARTNRSQAYKLKQELDRLKIFHDYEDRFLDLFKEPG
ncbi:MAG: PAC2 family protein [Luteolibacter sp.]